eukprot:jgi/Chlat1/7877/Chrsp66S07344
MRYFSTRVLQLPVGGDGVGVHVLHVEGVALLQQSARLQRPEFETITAKAATQGTTSAPLSSGATPASSFTASGLIASCGRLAFGLVLMAPTSPSWTLIPSPSHRPCSLLRALARQRQPAHLQACQPYRAQVPARSVPAAGSGAAQLSLAAPSAAAAAETYTAAVGGATASATHQAGTAFCMSTTAAFGRAHLQRAHGFVLDWHKLTCAHSVQEMVC